MGGNGGIMAPEPDDGASMNYNERIEIRAAEGTDKRIEKAVKKRKKKKAELLREYLDDGLKKDGC